MTEALEDRCHCGRNKWEHINCFRNDCFRNGRIKVVQGDDPGDTNKTAKDEMGIGKIEQLVVNEQPTRMVPRYDPDNLRPFPDTPSALANRKTVNNPQANVPPGYGNGVYDQKEQVGNDLSAGGGLRMNSGKIRMELTPPEWEWALADVSTKGSWKYEPRNWEKGMEWSAMVGCAKRHLAKFEAGERYDGKEFNKEKGTTGCHHLAMAAWNLLALMSYDLRGKGKNDLPEEVTIELLNSVNSMGN